MEPIAHKNNTMKKNVVTLLLCLVIVALKAQPTTPYATTITHQVSNVDGVTIIQWQSQTETNTSYFIIERQLSNGLFEIIGTTPSNGNGTHTSTVYSFEDGHTTNEATSYQITLVYMDGTRTSWVVEQPPLELATTP